MRCGMGRVSTTVAGFRRGTMAPDSRSTRRARTCGIQGIVDLQGKDTCGGSSSSSGWSRLMQLFHEGFERFYVPSLFVEERSVPM